MKDFVGLQLLFLCMILAFSEQESGGVLSMVSVGCTSMFWAVVELTLLGQDHFLHSDTMSLGIGCPVTNIIPKKGCEFKYLVTECGIQKEVFSYGVIFYSALHYTITHKGVTGRIPLMCFVSRSFLDTTPSTTDNRLTESNNDLPPAKSGLSWNLPNTCLFRLPWIPYFQDPWVKPPHLSLLLERPHSLAYENANVSVF
ncbi:oocyte secreted protein family member 3 [Phyllostomus discolor]|uniref:Oocyte secreted protein family member 3 n=1 Tax=Phyllostomus discolor TaxID=89673 RepID=A0A834E8L3_9CHIR|nr:oocyte secreted protein family member 3 [Phyllostomus discolor]